MKRRIAIVVLCLLTIVLASCTKEIPLTTSNADKYIRFYCSYGNLKRKSIPQLGFYYDDATMTLSTNLASPGKLSNVSMTLEIKLPIGWHFKSIGHPDDKRCGTITIDLPYDGQMQKQFDITNIIGMPLPTTNCEIKVLSVNGSFMQKR